MLHVGHAGHGPRPPALVTTDMRRALFQKALLLPAADLPPLQRLCRELGSGAWREAQGGGEFRIDLGRIDAPKYTSISAFVDTRLERAAEAAAADAARSSEVVGGPGEHHAHRQGGGAAHRQGGALPPLAGGGAGHIGTTARAEYSRRHRSPPPAHARREQGWSSTGPQPLRASRAYQVLANPNPNPSTALALIPPPPPLPTASERLRARGGMAPPPIAGVRPSHSMPDIFLPHGLHQSG
ncbi:hypothetical protein T492DRAFT_854978, partial [Pavlovales sp. CCMP2436]